MKFHKKIILIIIIKNSISLPHLNISIPKFILSIFIGKNVLYEFFKGLTPWNLLTCSAGLMIK